MEILAPAGSRESLEAAVASGADAVYMGGSAFQARAFSAGVGDLADAAAYAHMWGVDVHFTLNTVILDREVEAFVQQAQEAVDAGVDALIVADLGALYILRTMFPDVPLHASTQLSIRSTQSARAYKMLGFRRVVLAREVPAPQVRDICQLSACEVEVFCHGALCVCGSGRCLMSSLLGGRSANRGACAQPCRLQYTLADKQGYFLNTRDLSLANEVQTLLVCGVSSLKIEGRMKGPLYVAAAVQAYREALAEGYVSPEAMEALVATFSRGFTTGAFGQDKERFQTDFPGHVGQELGKVQKADGQQVTIDTSASVHAGDTVAAGGADQRAVAVTSARRTKAGLRLTLADRIPLKIGETLYKKSDARVEKRLRDIVRKGGRKTYLEASFVALRDTPLRLTLMLPDGQIVTAHGPVPQKARTKATDALAIRAQIQRTGNTPFEIDELSILLDDGLSIPKSVINALRRDALDKAAALRTERYTDRGPVCPVPSLDGPKNDARPARIACLVETAAQAEACAPYADILYVPAVSDVRDVLGCAIVPVLSSMSSGDEIDAAMQKWGAVPYLTGCMLPYMTGCITGADFNVTNSYAIALLADQGVARITLSQELNTAQLRDLIVPPRVETEVIAYGHQVLMLTENCPVPCDKKRCRAKTEDLSLTDRTGKSFRVLRDNCKDCRVRLLNALPLWSADILEDIRCNVLRLEFTTETPERCAYVCKVYRDAMGGHPVPDADMEFTRGHLRRGLKASGQ